MKSATALLPVLICALLVPSLCGAQATARMPGVRAAAVSPMQLPHVPQRTFRAKVPEATFQVLEFTFTTGDDDLRDTSKVTAHLTFPDGSEQDCPLHGSNTYGRTQAGNDATVTWDNHSMHRAAPCHLDKPRTAADLKRTVIGLDMVGFGLNVSDTGDNWNINRTIVTAYNENSPERLCVFDGNGNPLARMTEYSELGLTDLPNRCR